MAASAGQQDRADGAVGAERAERLADRAEHLPVHGVEPILAGQLDMGHSPLSADLDPFASHSACSSFMPTLMTRFTVNGQPVEYRMDPETPLLWALRDASNLTGTK